MSVVQSITLQHQDCVGLSVRIEEDGIWIDNRTGEPVGPKYARALVAMLTRAADIAEGRDGSDRVFAGDVVNRLEEIAKDIARKGRIAMTRNELDKLTDRELDALVAESVFGRRLCSERSLDRYSATGDGMLAVMEWMSRNLCDNFALSYDDDTDTWWCKVGDDAVYASTAPRAVAIAAVLVAEAMNGATE